MSESAMRISGYRVGVNNINGFFGVWLKRNLPSRRRLIITGVFAIGMLAMMAWSVKPWDFYAKSNLPSIWFAAHILTFLLFSLAFTLLISALVMYVLSPLATYLQLLAGYWLGPVSRRVSDAEITDAGILKTTDSKISTLAWADIHEVTASKETILIFTNRNCAMMLPKVGFGSPEAAQSFLDTALTRWQAAMSVK